MKNITKLLAIYSAMNTRQRVFIIALIYGVKHRKYIVAVTLLFLCLLTPLLVCGSFDHSLHDCSQTNPVVSLATRSFNAMLLYASWWLCHKTEFSKRCYGIMPQLNAIALGTILVPNIQNRAMGSVIGLGLIGVNILLFHYIYLIVNRKRPGALVE